MIRSGSSTFRGRDTFAARTYMDQDLSYATIPRAGTINRRRNPHLANNYEWNSGGGSGLGFGGNGNAVSSRGSAGLYNTYGRGEGQNVMGSFRNSDRVQVVDGLVMNRFQKSNGISATGGQGSVMNSGFYNTLGSTPYSPTSPGVVSKQNKSSTPSHSSPGLDDNFDTYELDMSTNRRYSGRSPHCPEKISKNHSLSRRIPSDNKSSLLLSAEENQVIFDIIGEDCQTLATAVVQLVVPNVDESKWQVKETGVVCLVRDTPNESYFIQVFSLGTRRMVFRQEIYNQFKYEMSNHNNFLTFEGDRSTVGILFADRTEAALFRAELNILEDKRQRHNEREHCRSRLKKDINHHRPSSSHVQSQWDCSKEKESDLNGVDDFSSFSDVLKDENTRQFIYKARPAEPLPTLANKFASQAPWNGSPYYTSPPMPGGGVPPPPPPMPRPLYL